MEPEELCAFFDLGATEPVDEIRISYYQPRVTAYITNAPPGVTFTPVLGPTYRLMPLPPTTSQQEGWSPEVTVGPQRLWPIRREPPCPN